MAMCSLQNEYLTKKNDFFQNYTKVKLKIFFKIIKEKAFMLKIRFSKMTILLFTKAKVNYR